MAAVSIQQSPSALSSMSNMSSRRAPLSNNPNAANSPYRAVATAAAQKQKRSFATIQREDHYGQAPPAKKQIIERRENFGWKTPPRQSAAQAEEGRVFRGRSNASQPTTFERKLEAARVRPATQSVHHVVLKPEQPSEEVMETIRTWQKHYRKVFPNFVFYFESIPEDIRAKYVKQINYLGAREERFFSNSVTHVITTRAIPPELRERNETTPEVHAEEQVQRPQSQTINPSLLDRSSKTSGSQAQRGKFTFEAPIGRRGLSQVQDIDVRKSQGRSTDVLQRARQMRIKIWALEKLQRIMTTIFETETGEPMAVNYSTRSHTAQADITTSRRAVRNIDLSQLLRDERINGPSDRDPTVASTEIITFKGPFVYVHDIDEKRRPIMVRDYPKVSHKEQGEWPQFRSVANGKCPFVEEIDYAKREQEREQARQQKQLEKEQSVAPRTRAAAAGAKMHPPNASQGRQALAKMEDGTNRTKVSASIKQPATFGDELSSKSHQNAFVSRAASGRLFAGEPVASGVQPSNITSAIRSQMISSTAAAPGAKAGTSKEVHGLQRKVLERNSGPTSIGLTSSHRMTDLAAAAREERETSRPAVRRAGQDKLAQFEEELTPAELEARRMEATRRTKAVQKRKSEKRDAKPGYCENCMDKFDDFDDHILSRKHRKFATQADNWAELDKLLSQLVRPLRVDSTY